jgi:predicted aspartyl protease
MADGVRLICWPTADRFAIGIRVGNLANQWHSETEDLIQIDTGYSEAVLLPYNVFESLNLLRWRLPRVTAPIGTSVTGEVIHFIEAYAQIVVPQSDGPHTIIVQSFLGNKRFLIGRAFLRHFKVLLDGPGEQTCLLLPYPVENQ